MMLSIIIPFFPACKEIVEKITSQSEIEPWTSRLSGRVSYPFQLLKHVMIFIATNHVRW